LIQGRVDSDALTYISKVERTDGASLEPGIKVAINEFVVNCKAFGLWDKLSLICIFSGARTIDGAVLTLKGPMESVTLFNFVAADYDRRNGFAGDGTTKWMSTDTYLGSSEALDDYHIAFSLTTVDTAGNSPVYGFGGGNYDLVQTRTANPIVRSRSLTDTSISAPQTGFSCVSRDQHLLGVV